MPTLSDGEIVTRLYNATLAGDAAAARSLGDLAAEGLLNQGNPDWHAAAQWYSLAIDGPAPDPEALFTLGYQFLLGKGIAPDAARARALFAQAATLQQGAALYWLGEMARQGLGGPVDQPLAIDSLQRAAALAVPGADEALLQLFGEARDLATLSLVERSTRQTSSATLLALRHQDQLGRLPRADLRRVQQALASAGFDPQGIDGVMGPNSRAALSAFRLSRGESAEPVLSLQDLQALGLL